MDLSTIVGLILALVILVIVLIMDGGSPAELFAHPSAIILIVGGSLMATTVASPLEVMLRIPKMLMISAKDEKFDIQGAIERIASMADKARRDGLLALEEESKKIDDAFLKRGIMMVVDGVDPSQVKAILMANITQMKNRHKAGYEMFAAAGAFAPTFGIIGTVMGLISVLKQLDDPNKLATSIAGAFLATLWGLLMANLIYLPMGGKLKAKSTAEVNYRVMLMEGILAIQAGENPRIIREKLGSYLPPAVLAKAESAAPEKA
ncbi:hypothetical protein ADN00_17230 [Ornatilinea apprima]|uniref:MotA/TolQ/ExbB proton channel domain-containing protein n=1 Tax=Ornatilinea apprima TaxID=1134406 RepID=A0A0P6WY20_9CHLR|nr:motility protein A [Ornatilinea apprima]KPL71431.1 hypothetical protein ADN00_17230 [Ornatilinea apprima]